jgi:uridylate kinase
MTHDLKTQQTIDAETVIAMNQEIQRLTKLVTELKVVIDTGQTALRRADNTITEESARGYVFVQSAIWFLDFKT